MQMELTAPIVEIFKSLEGEGFAIGTPTIFIRLAGCDVGCKFCDSKQTWDQRGFPKLTILEVLAAVSNLQKGTTIHRISITGGEPLMHEHFLLDLADALLNSSRYYTINLETSGTKFPESIFSNGVTSDYFDSISMDLKTPSSGVDLSDEQIARVRQFASKSNVYTKAIAGSKEDVDFVLDIFRDTQVNDLVLTPCEIAGQFFSVDDIYEVLDRRMVDLNKFPLRIIAQQHKLLSFR
jgi:organic radical activating enzyme